MMPTNLVIISSYKFYGYRVLSLGGGFAWLNMGKLGREVRIDKWECLKD
jgi:hypothetical protein